MAVKDVLSRTVSLSIRMRRGWCPRDAMEKRISFHAEGASDLCLRRTPIMAEVA
jgi:hypothetical protein